MGSLGPESRGRPYGSSCTGATPAGCGAHWDMCRSPPPAGSAYCCATFSSDRIVLEGGRSRAARFLSDGFAQLGAQRRQVDRASSARRTRSTTAPACPGSRSRPRPRRASRRAHVVRPVHRGLVAKTVMRVRSADALPGFCRRARTRPPRLPDPLAPLLRGDGLPPPFARPARPLCDRRARPGPPDVPVERRQAGAGRSWLIR